MAASPDTVSMAMFCDFENVALGVRDAKYEKFDIKPVLERLLLKGSIVLKKAYCDWERYKSFKATMHEANFELIEIPHVRQSGKNSADIRMVVDALDLCYTKSHVNTFVIVSGDSDFSPLVSKLRENAKYVIGVGVKQSTSDLLIANCDEFIFYDDLVREVQRSAARRDPKSPQHAAKRSPEEDKKRKDELEARKSQAIDLAVATFEALIAERGDSGKIWASMLKEAIKRRRPDFNETYFGFRAFGNLLEEAQVRGLLELGRDEKSGAFVYRSSGAQIAANHRETQVANEETLPAVAGETRLAAPTGSTPPETVETVSVGVGAAPGEPAPPSQLEPAVTPEPIAEAPKRRGRGSGKRTPSKGKESRKMSADKEGDAPKGVASSGGSGGDDGAATPAEPRPLVVALPQASEAAAADLPGTPTTAVAAEKKPAARGRRPRKPKAAAATTD